MYHYFKGNRIKSFKFEVNTTINKAYTPLTAEQSAFYELHPQASCYEVRMCALFEDTPAPPVPIGEAVESAKSYISELSGKTMGRFVSDLKLANAQASLELLRENAGTPIYTEEQALATIADFNRIGGELRAAFHSFSEELDECQSIEAVNEVINNAQTFYNGYSGN